MRNLVLAMLAASGLAMIGTAPAGAVGTRHPFCIQGTEQPGLSNCTFDSYQQCQATASGRFLYCVESYYIAGDPEREPIAVLACGRSILLTDRAATPG